MAQTPTMTVNVVPELPEDFAQTIVQATRLRVGEGLAAEGLLMVKEALLIADDSEKADRVAAMLADLFSLLNPTTEES